MTFPNVIIAGAPKCGSSSLFKWLADHPDVCGSSIKETRYFLDPEFPGIRPFSNYHRHGMEGYGEYFDHCDGDAKIILEATPTYLYQQTALRICSRISSSPLFIFVLRNPSERVYSLYNFAKNNTADIDKNMSFRDFISEVRKGENGIFADSPILRDVIEHSKYAVYLDKWIETVGKERVFILFFEDMKRDPLAFMSGIAKRLNITHRFYETYDFEVRMRTVRIKSQIMHRMLKGIFGQKYKTSRLNFIPIGSLRDFLKKTYFAINTTGKREGKSEDDLKVIAELDKEFASSKVRIADMTGMDLSSWM